MVPASLNVERDDIEAEVFAPGGEQPFRHLRRELVVVVLSRLDRLQRKEEATLTEERLAIPVPQIYKNLVDYSVLKISKKISSQSKIE